MREPFGTKTHPAENAFGKPVVFGHVQYGVNHFALHNPKILRTVFNIGVGNSVNHFIKQRGKTADDFTLSFSVHTLGGGYVIVFIGKRMQHLRD